MSKQILKTDHFSDDVNSAVNRTYQSDAARGPGRVRECCLEEVMLVLRQAVISGRKFQAGKQLRSSP